MSIQQQPSAHLYLRTIEDLWGFLVKNDGLSVDVAGPAAGHGHEEDEDEVGGHRGRVFTPGAASVQRQHNAVRQLALATRDLLTQSGLREPAR